MGLTPLLVQISNLKAYLYIAFNLIFLELFTASVVPKVE